MDELNAQAPISAVSWHCQRIGRWRTKELNMKFGRQLENQEIDIIENGLAPTDEVTEDSWWVCLWDLPGVGRVATGGDYGGAWGDYFVVPEGSTARQVLDWVLEELELD
jgi:hypothetical protein